MLLHMPSLVGSGHSVSSIHTTVAHCYSAISETLTCFSALSLLHIEICRILPSLIPSSDLALY